MTTYRSKIGLELIIPLSLLFAGLMTVFILNRIWAGLAIILAVEAFVIFTFVSTRYIVRDTSLRIISGFFYDETIDIRTITYISSIRNAMSSPAASLDRMEVRSTSHDAVLISPLDKKGFLNHLLRIHPAIVVRVPEFE